MQGRIRRQVFEVLEYHEGDDRISRCIDLFLIILIISNVVAVVLESVPEIGGAYARLFAIFDTFSVIVFTIEFGLRVWAAPEEPAGRFAEPIAGRARYMASPMALIDFLAIAPYYLSFIISVDLRFLRVFRILRLLKLTRYSPALATVGDVLHAQRRQLLAAMMIMLTLLVVSASVAYLLEHAAQPDVFGSIPDAMWWTMATLTTVGFGDVTPVTPMGKVFGGLLMIMGVGMYAIPAGILATGFAREFRKRDFTVSWRMVARVPVFQNLDALTIAEIANSLQPLVVPQNQTVFRRGEHAESMFFIATGEIEVDIHPKPIRLGHGEHFGEIALVKNRPRSTTVTAITECQLMILEVGDFKRLMADHPDLATHMEKITSQRLAELESIGHPV
ncbi:MAG: cyclic nucleotide-binding domain-containing protein [Rhodospirillaceae bacterium]|nr:cyclic nucleotide-binding domain-containing protein [Rhodospirillaceae bacterium]